MSSYAARASRRTQAGGAAESKAVPPNTTTTMSRPQLHSRKHSANSAGDVFAMLGQPMGSKVSAARDKDRHTTIHETSIMEEPPTVDQGASTGQRTNNSISSPSSSSPSTPSSSLPTTGENASKSTASQGEQSKKRYETLYSKPALLKLWKSQLSVTAVFDELYSAFETPEQQQLHLEGVSQHKYANSRNHSVNEGGERTANHDRGPRRDRDALARIPAAASSTSMGSASSSGLALPPNARRTSSGSGNFGPGSHAGVFQGGVLPGVGGPIAKKSETGLPLPADFQRAPASARSRLFNERDKPAGPTPTSGWASNRWRHLQADDDSHISSSGSSTKDENEDHEVWARPAESSEGQWRPGQHDAIEREKQALLRSQAVQPSAPRSQQDVLSQPSWRRQDAPLEHTDSRPHEATQASNATTGSTVDNAGNRPHLPTSTSNQSLFLDDLLGPTRLHNQPTSVHSSRSNSIVNNMSSMQLGTEPALSQSTGATSRFSTSAHSTPTRASAAEGLEVLARRSPVQELSMAALQQQRPLHTPPTTGGPHFRPTTAPHPTNEPADRIFWQYRDPQGQLQGPFSVVQMQEWYSQGFFNDTLLVKRVESTDYETLGALIIRLRDVNLPFFSAPLIHHVYAAPPGMQAPGLGQPPFQRMASPTPWQHRQASPLPEQIQQPANDQRNPSFTAGNAVYDLFSKAQQPVSKSPETLVVHLPEAKHVEATVAASQPTSEPVHDPWADMTPAAMTGAGIPRGSSALGGEHVEAEGATLRQSAPGHHFSSVAVNALRQDSLPSPIGRSPSISIRQEPISKIRPIVSPAKQDMTQLPVVEGALPASKPTEGLAPQNKTAAAPSAPQEPPSSLLSGSIVNQKKAAADASASDKTINQSTMRETVPKPVNAKEADKAPTSRKVDGVSVVSQDDFDKQRKGPTAAASQIEIPLSDVAPTSSPQLETPSTTARKAAPWAKPVDDSKTTPGDTNQPKTASGMSLREIQAKEQKDAEARRAQEKKLHAAQRAAEEAALAERRAKEASEGLPLTARWGDSAASSPSAAAPPSAPWAKIAPGATAAAKAGKKTLKEIQEEEEARRKAAQQSQAQKVSKAYANTIAHAVSSPASDSPWQTVGATKPATPSASASVRPPGMNGAAANVAGASRPAVQSSYSMASKLAGQAAKPATPVTAPAAVRTLSSASGTPASAISGTVSNKENEPAFPASSDLLKWCKEALKGLEIPIDDFIQMLLSFPVPLDKSTRELISDSVYASSRTLDGRYFSDAFADKRLADTKAIKLGKSVPVSVASFFGNTSISTSSSTGRSMADAIKFIPAQKGPELNFKVVTKSKGKKK